MLTACCHNPFNTRDQIQIQINLCSNVAIKYSSLNPFDTRNQIQIFAVVNNKTVAIDVASQSFQYKESDSDTTAKFKPTDVTGDLQSQSFQYKVSNSDHKLKSGW